MPRSPFVDDQLDAMLTIVLSHHRPMLVDEVLYSHGRLEQLVILRGGKIHRVAFARNPIVGLALRHVPGIVMQPPTVEAIEQPGAFFGSPGKEPAGPIQVTAVRSRRNILSPDAVAWHGGREAPILRRIFFRREVAATAPRLITDAPKL